MAEPSAHNVGFVEAVEQAYPLMALEALLMDRTTGHNIIWADSEYEALGEGYMAQDEITTDAISGLNSGVIKPRIAKEQERQSRRTRSRAEVFTPSWLCNQMNNDIDEVWFGRPNVFNLQEGTAWKPTDRKIRFQKAEGRTWQDYVDCQKLEITCGEAPFICSRYDTVTGGMLPVKQRIGFLDRKLRVVTENTDTYADWLTWAMRAVQSSYGYEYQGDNLVLARINVLETLAEHMEARWDKRPDNDEAVAVTEVISWNVWQMDGLTGTVPSDKLPETMQDNVDQEQIVFSDLDEQPEERAPLCQIYDWIENQSQTYASLKSKGF